MPINFPTGPSVNDLYTFNGRTWKWNGEGWQAEPASYGPQGPQGDEGPQGPQGPSVTDASLLTSGTLASARLPAGTILQVVQASTNTFVSLASGSYADTGLTASITPSSASSKILVIVDQSASIRFASAGNAYFGVRLVRGSTVIVEPVTSATGPFEYGSDAGSEFFSRVSIVRLDSPSTTSSVTYKTTGRRYNNGNVEFQCSGGTNNGTSYMTLIEVAG